MTGRIPASLVVWLRRIGTSAQLCAELFKQLAGLPDIVHVPYRGANPGLADFYSGQLPMFAAAISPQVLAMHNRGTIRILVAGTDRRLKAAPEIPISTDVGFPDLITVQFMGLFAPAGTPKTDHSPHRRRHRGHPSHGRIPAEADRRWLRAVIEHGAGTDRKICQ